MRHDFWVQASGFRDELILHTCEREGPSHWQYHKVVAKLDCYSLSEAYGGSNKLFVIMTVSMPLCKRAQSCVSRTHSARGNENHVLFTGRNQITSHRSTCVCEPPISRAAIPK
jgi:hypothetical protein